MKKKKIKSLSLSKKTVSTLTQVNNIKGGGPTEYNCNGTRGVGCITHHPTCLVPSGVSLCIRCIEDFTEGCDSEAFCF